MTRTSRRSDVSALIAKLRARSPRPPLAPDRPWSAGITKDIESSGASELLKAALHIWNDDIERSHTLAQEDPSSTGSLIHAVLHRRETEYWNSKYWLRQTGAHPVLKALAEEFEGWDPFSHVDRCEGAERGPAAEVKSLEGIQARELELLAEHCR